MIRDDNEGHEFLAGQPAPVPGGPRHDAFLGEVGLAGARSTHGGPDLRTYWRLLLRQRWLVLAVVAIVVVAAIATTLLTAPVYRATTMLQIDREAVKVVEFDAMTPVERGGSGDDFYQTQYELLKSRAITERVVTDLQLDRNTAAQAALHLPDPKGTPRQIAIDRATAALMPALTVDPVRNSRLVRIHVDMTDPALAATIANAVAQAFIQSNLERHFDAASYATKFLKGRLQQLKVRLEGSERDLVQYAQSAQLVSDKDGLSRGESLSDLNSALAGAINDRISAQARLQQVQATGTSGIPADMLDKSIVRTLQARRAEIQSDYQDKRRILKPDYPAMRQLQSQLDEVDRQIQAELGSIRASVRSEYDAAMGRERLLNAQIGLARSDALDIEKRGIQYNILKREVDTNRELYDGLLQRYKEVGVAGGVSTNNVSVVDTAKVPKQKFEPSLSRNLLLSLLFGSILGIALAFLIEYLDDRVRGPGDVERLFGVPVLGIIPKLRRGSTPLEAAADLRSAFAESYRSLRTSLQFSTVDGVPRTLLITSASPGEGKTTTALLLARNFAELGKRVLLIDADLRNPTLHTVSKSPNGKGLTSFLAGVASIGEVVQATGMDNLWLIPAGPLPPKPAELLAGARLEQLLARGALDYDQVIIDGPPVMGLADAPQIAHLADGTIVMMASGKARRGAIRSALKRLAAVRAHVLGTVITMYDPRQSGAQDDYGAYSYYGYAARPDGK